MDEPKLRQRIGYGTDFLMKIVAAGLDFIGLLLFWTGIGGTIVGIMGDLTLFVWYLTKGLPLWKGKSVKNAGINFLAELIPIFNDFYPGFSVFVWTNNRQIRKEDEEYNAKIMEEYEKKAIGIKTVAVMRQNEYAKQQKMIEELNNAEANSLAGEIDKQMVENQRIIKLNDIRSKDKNNKSRDRHYTPLRRAA